MNCIEKRILELSFKSLKHQDDKLDMKECLNCGEKAVLTGETPPDLKRQNFASMVTSAEKAMLRSKALNLRYVCGHCKTEESFKESFFNCRVCSTKMLAFGADHICPNCDYQEPGDPIEMA